MSLLKVVVLSAVSAIIIFVSLFNSLHHVDVVNINNTQQAAINAIYDVSK